MRSFTRRIGFTCMTEMAMRQRGSDSYVQGGAGSLAAGSAGGDIAVPGEQERKRGRKKGREREGGREGGSQQPAHRRSHRDGTVSPSQARGHPLPAAGDSRARTLSVYFEQVLK